MQVRVLSRAQEIFEKQRLNRWILSQSTADERIAKLKRIKTAIFARREEIHQAIYDDFRKNPGETDMTEIFPAISEINHSIRHLSRWMRPKKVRTPLPLFGTRSEIRYEAKGVVLILSPWNYPFQLLMGPLIAAIAAGNCVVLKPSSKTPHTARFLKKFISDLFPEEEVALFEGDSSVADALLELPFDHIFFTGSPAVGKKIMTSAAKNLSPVTLELGGKSPVIVDETAPLKTAAERILWGKFVNAGQTCVAPDYLLIHEAQVEGFIREARKVISARYGATAEDQARSPDFCRVVSDDRLHTLKKILEESVQKGARIECGGSTNSNGRYLAPTLLSHVTPDSPIMQEEIFGPILPILTFRTIDEAVRLIQSGEKPLALYIFSKNREAVEKVLQGTTAGGTCVNSLMIHLANTNLPFGGVGKSGMGNYHGFFGFRTFSHERAVLRQGWPDVLKSFYPPYTNRVKKMIRLITRFLT